MLCLTGNENSNRKLLERLLAPLDYPQPLVYEVRADLLNESPDFAGIFDSGSRIIFTCRSKRQGGAFTGGEGERSALIEKAIEHNAWAIDIELDTAPELRERLVKKARARGVKVILSQHSSETCSDINAAIARLCATDADIYKFVAPVTDSSELCDWLDIENDGRLILIASGAAGQLTRFWFRRFASPFTYVAMDETRATAEFQPTLADVRNGRIMLDDGCDTFLILGGSQIIKNVSDRKSTRLNSSH